MSWASFGAFVVAMTALCIVPGPAAIELYRQITTSPGLKVGGLHAYDGHLRGNRDRALLRIALLDDRPELRCDRLRRHRSLPRRAVVRLLCSVIWRAAPDYIARLDDGRSHHITHHVRIGAFRRMSAK